MPNHITNILRVTGYEHERAPADLIDKVIAAVKGEGPDGAAFDFNRLIPMPPDLNIVSGGATSDALALLSDAKAKEMLDWPWVTKEGVTTIEALRELLRKRFSQTAFARGFHDHHDKFGTLDALAKRVKSNLEKYGATTWYEWCCDHWGTKWNAYDVTVGKTDDNEVTFHFQTAWSPPMPVLDALAKKFPKAHIRLIWCDEGDDRAHRVYWAKGKREHDEDAAEDDAS